jgi:peptide chain release factor 1
LERLDKESGGHRIQRIPPTERRGRIHTSTVTVAIISPNSIQEEFQEDDIKIEWFSGTGAGGQYRNKVQTSCRAIHLPTGISAQAQTRSRENSKKEAFDTLRKRVDGYYLTSRESSANGIRKSMVGSGQRGDKIRTYRFKDNVVIDHKTNTKHKLDDYLAGKFK